MAPSFVSSTPEERVRQRRRTRLAAVRARERCSSPPPSRPTTTNTVEGQRRRCVALRRRAAVTWWRTPSKGRARPAARARPAVRPRTWRRGCGCHWNAAEVYQFSAEQADLVMVEARPRCQPADHEDEHVRHEPLRTSPSKEPQCPSSPDPINILVPRSWREKTCRVAPCCQLGASGAGLAALADRVRVVQQVGGDHERPAPHHHGPRRRRPPAARQPTTRRLGGASVPAGSVPAGYSESRPTRAAARLNMYTWGEYNDPSIVGRLGRQGPRHHDEGRLLHEQRRPHHQALHGQRQQWLRCRSCPPGPTSRR